MTRMLCFTIMLFGVAGVHAQYLNGYVGMNATQTQFTSEGVAQYFNRDNETDGSAVLSGEHKVTQVYPELVYRVQVTGAGRYEYLLEGPASINLCYRGFMHVAADPPGASNTISRDYGPFEDCSERDCLDLNNNGVCDSAEPVDKDPNADSCPGGPPCTSPIIINLGKGTWQLSGSAAPVEFDIDDDGAPNRITWTENGSAVAFLAFDRNASGSIESGAELFGNWTRLASGARAANGFEALRELDSNADGMLSDADAAWSHLLLWRDTNHDGVSQAAELQRVSATTITALETAHFWTGRRDAHGNLFAYQGRAYFDGRPRVIYDIYFQSVP